MVGHVAGSGTCSARHQEGEAAIVSEYMCCVDNYIP